MFRSPSFPTTFSLVLRTTTRRDATTYIGVGSNIEPRFPSIQTGAELINQLPNTTVIDTSYLYETKPMYVTDQDSFLNGVIKVETELEPRELLEELKNIEANVGRKPSIRNGPRKIDLDILLYDSQKINDDHPTLPLQIPHPRISEREFVLRPLLDLFPSYAFPLLEELNEHEAIRVLPLSNNRTLKMNETKVMGILNVTPDSFSDGGETQCVSSAVERAKFLIKQGAHIIDIGGESTRPDATPVPADEELKRINNVIEKLRIAEPDCVISIDTRNSNTALEAVKAGADIVNDVSGGTWDPKMYATVGGLKVPYCIMHSRGNPENMKELAVYDDVVKEVVEEIKEKAERAKKENVFKWSMIYDVGIGFAKTFEHNLILMKEGKRVQEELGGICLWGGSRKGFLREILNVDVKERDYGTVAAHQFSIQNSPTGQILRVHNVLGTSQACKVFDAIKDVEFKPGEDKKDKVKRGTDPLAKKPTKVCDPYGQGGKPLTVEQAKALLPTLDGSWELTEDAGSMKRVFELESWQAAQKLQTTLSNVAFNNNHYPSITLKRRLNRANWTDTVEVEMYTEVLGGLSYKDFEIATYIDVEASRL